ncbi:MAG TPA: two-component sensor histidine kinase [Verrucomicrobia bacterium]|nr:MAG: hypothetical protein A2X46_13905 [Lentisphaerae bacterium GWF2_57_35]HBA84780.1 two-component sensor histidine kinase [Verrucomicrobiota bacterium]
MPETEQDVAESGSLRARLGALEETHRATLNILEDFDEEKSKLARLLQATMNLLEDFDSERNNLQQFQKATLNLLEDVNVERSRSQKTQRATLNILEDVHEERDRLNQTQRALINILEDIEVERTRTEKAKSLLEGVVKDLEAFSYSVSHDLRAPLRAVSGFAQALIEDCAPRLDEKGKRYLGLIQASALKMGQLIDDLLAFSRLGRQQMMDACVDLESLAHSVYEELIAQISGRPIEFVVHPVPPACGDQAMIRQVLVNLLSNAIKFTRMKEKATIEFGYRAEPHPGAYCIKDNGAGFDMKYVDKLFGVFQRLHDVKEFEGTGVGLALVSLIIARHGGRVWAEGQVGKGAAFYFTLPSEKQNKHESD